MSVSITGDPENLGVNWTLYCLGSPITPAPANPCGTIAPAYVGATNGLSMTYTAPAYIPVGNTVTLTASLTSNPAINESVTIAIAPLPITVAITAPPPPTVGVSGSAPIIGTVTNDANSAGLMWSLSCGSTVAGGCGSLQSGLPVPTETASGLAITYTAPPAIPAGGTVTIKATSITDSTKSASVTVTIAGISVSVTPPTVNVPVFTTADLTATVLYDSASAGVDWVIQPCGTAGDCGSLSVGNSAASHTASGQPITYNAPSSVPAGSTVMIVAASTTNPAAAATVTVTVTPPPPIEIAVTPATASAQVNGTVNLTGTLTYDTANAGAQWTLTCGSAGLCGTISPNTASGQINVYTAPAAIPAGGTVTVTAASVTTPTTAASSTITVVPAIGIAFTPAAATSITAGIGAAYTASVSNDLAPGGVDWTATCAASPCGTFNPAHTASGAPTTFTTPATAPAGTVTITATSTASIAANPVRSVSATVTVVPVIGVTFVPFAPSQLQVSNQLTGLVTSPPVNLLAAVLNDSANQGIDWSVCSNAATCGEFQVKAAQAATATTAVVNAVYSATLHTSSGQAAAYIPPAQPPSSGTVIVTAKAHNPAATSTAATATATIAIVNDPMGLALSGTVLAGKTPVAGATVTLYAAGTTGYSSLSSPLTISGGGTTVTTNASGAFAIPAGYACPSPSSQLYLVATGGNAGGGTNPNLAMMTALGSCGGLNSDVGVVVNEVTTVASVWALSPFLSDYEHLGSSAANATSGLANAFAEVNDLVNITTGVALARTPFGSSAVPNAEIDTLADILNTCNITSGGALGDGSACGILFGVANPGLIASTAPTNTLQAAINIAQNPWFGTSPGQGIILYTLLPSTYPFSPVLTAAPNDWTIALNFTGGGLSARAAAASLAVDAAGNVWVTAQRFNSVVEFNSLGAPLSPPATGTTNSTSGGFTGGGLSSPNLIAVDPLGDVWVANTASLTELSPLGVPLSPASGYSGGGLSTSILGLAIDGLGNVWTANSGSPGNLSWFAGANATIGNTPIAPGAALSPAAGITQGVNSPSGAIAVDTSGTVWELNTGDMSAGEFNSANGNFIQSDYGYTQTVPTPSGSVLTISVSSDIAIDNAGDVFETANEELAELIAGGSAANDGGLGIIENGFGDSFASYLAIDGNGHLWTQINNNACTTSGSVVVMSASAAPLNLNSYGCGYLGAGISVSNHALALDGSGNVWVLSNGTLAELIGVAAPVATPFSTSVQNKTLGKKP